MLPVLVDDVLADVSGCSVGCGVGHATLAVPS